MYIADVNALAIQRVFIATFQNDIYLHTRPTFGILSSNFRNINVKVIDLFISSFEAATLFETCRHSYKALYEFHG